MRLREREPVFARNRFPVKLTTISMSGPSRVTLFGSHGGGLTHIGMVVDREALLFDRYEVLHNIGRGPQIEDVLF